MCKFFFLCVFGFEMHRDSPWGLTSQEMKLLQLCAFAKVNGAHSGVCAVL